MRCGKNLKCMPAIVWKGYITFGLVSFPVRLYSAARADTLHFHMLHRKDLSRVKEVWYCAEENKPIERAEIVKGYETGKGEYVVVEEEELKKIAPSTASSMDVIQFVEAADVDAIYLERSYYVAPGDDLTKPYVLFLKALQETKYSAIAKVWMHGREHVVLIRPSGGQLVLHTLFYPDELHKSNQPAILAKTHATRKELDLATQLIHQLSGPFEPEQFQDAYRQNLEKMVEQKKNGQKVTREVAPRRPSVINLVDALKKSLASTAPSGKAVGAAKSKARASKTGRGRKVA